MRLLFLLILFPFLINAQVKDVDGNKYDTCHIYNQVWLKNNLRVKHFRNGDPIPYAKDWQAWLEAGQKGKPAYCLFEHQKGNEQKYGLLYNWYAVNDPRGLAPKGYRVASLEDWNEMIDSLGSYHEGEVIMAKDVGWGEQLEPSDDFGFGAQPAGWRDYELTEEEDEGFFNCDGVVQWWTSSKANREEAYGLDLGYCQGYNIADGENPKGNGAYIRCIKN